MSGDDTLSRVALSRSAFDRWPKQKRPAHRPPRYPGEEMTNLTVRLPVRLKERLLRLSGGRTGEWVCDRIEKARERESET